MDIATTVGIFSGVGLVLPFIRLNSSLGLFWTPLFSHDCELTDNIPIKTEQHSSNWELSAANIARKLVRATFPPKKLSVEGFAEFRPEVSNDRAKAWDINMRIEIVYQLSSIKKCRVDILRS